MKRSFGNGPPPSPFSLTPSSSEDENEELCADNHESLPSNHTNRPFQKKRKSDSTFCNEKSGHVNEKSGHVNEKSGHVNLITYNLNGIGRFWEKFTKNTAKHRVTLSNFLNQFEADIICFQETKLMQQNSLKDNPRDEFKQHLFSNEKLASNCAYHLHYSLVK